MLFNIIPLAGIALRGIRTRRRLKYDTSRKGKLLFLTGKGADSTNTLYLDRRIVRPVSDESVKNFRPRLRYPLMGTIADYDRTFAVMAIHDTTSYFTSGRYSPRTGGRQRREDC